MQCLLMGNARLNPHSADDKAIVIHRTRPENDRREIETLLGIFVPASK